MHRRHTPTPNVKATAALVMSEVFAHYSTWLARSAEYHAQGYRNPTCVHGMPVCFESDISCGDCEDEVSPENFTFEDALKVAQDRIDEYDRREVEVYSEDARRRIASAEDGIIFA